MHVHAAPTALLTFAVMLLHAATFGLSSDRVAIDPATCRLLGLSIVVVVVAMSDVSCFRSPSLSA